jgi:electron transfer flavoprotein alpha subunit
VEAFLVTVPVIAALVLPMDRSPNPMDPVRLAQAMAARGPGRAVAIIAGATHDENLERAGTLGIEAAWSIADAHLSDGATFERLVAAFAAALRSADIIADDCVKLVLLPFGALGDELAARLAAQLNGTPLGQCSEILFDGSACAVTRLGYGGRAKLHLRATRPPYFAVVRPGWAPNVTIDTRPQMRRFDAALPDIAADPVLRTPHPGGHRPPLEGAKVIVSGGRGMGNADNFALLDRLAAALGGVVGGSLPVADAGWLPTSRQIGQSGKYVTPELYVAVAISGSSQHLAGIGDGVRIMVINQDPDAPIWTIAEIGAVGDWKLILPALLEELGRSAPA